MWAYGDPFLFSVELILQSLEFSACFGYLEVESFLVIKPVSLVLGLGATNGSDGERHVGPFLGV